MTVYTIFQMICAARRNSSWSRLHALQAKLHGSLLHGFHTEADVLVEIDAELLRAIDDVLTAHRSGESFVLHLLPYRLSVNFENAALRLDVRDSGDETRKLVACEQCLFKR